MICAPTEPLQQASVITATCSGAPITNASTDLTPEMRPQDTYGDGRDWTFKPSEHGGDEPDNMPQAIKASDAVERWASYVPLTRAGKKMVVPRPCIS